MSRELGCRYWNDRVEMGWSGLEHLEKSGCFLLGEVVRFGFIDAANEEM
jgi:hypothetical protein